MTGLPRFIAFKARANGKYWNAKLEGGNWSLAFEGDEVLTPFTRFELEIASNQPISGRQLFNIKSCYNNKYWAGQEQREQAVYIICEANQPDEDPSKQSSTLFDVVVNQTDEDADADDVPKIAKIIHYWNGASKSLNAMIIAFILIHDISFSGTPLGTVPSPEFVEIIDLENMMIMPKFVAFKHNDKSFLQIQTIKNHDYLQFSDAYITDQSVWNEIVTNSDGSIRIRSMQTGNFWGIYIKEDGWVCAIKEEESNTVSDPKWSLFTPRKVEKHMIALRNVGNKNFCARFTDDLVGQDLLCANHSTITTEARLQVVELVTSRKIYILSFHKERAKVTESKIQVLPTEEVTNNGKDPVTRKVNFDEEIITVSAWSTINSGDFGVPVSIEVPFTTSIEVPFTTSISFGKILVKPDSVTDYQWGEYIEKKKARKIEDTITVQPRKKASVRFSATKVRVEIPFSYKRLDTLTCGETKIYDNIQDGVYTYIGTTEETTTVDEEKLKE